MSQTMKAHALVFRPFATAVLGLFMAIALLLCLRSTAVAQQAPEDTPPPPADTRTASTEDGEDGEEVTRNEDAEAQARLDNPFGRTRPMFGPNGVRGIR